MGPGLKDVPSSCWDDLLMPSASSPAPATALASEIVTSDLVSKLRPEDCDLVSKLRPEDCGPVSKLRPDDCDLVSKLRPEDCDLVSKSGRKEIIQNDALKLP